jgi:diguanylate cyclase (GGDEF)-like protein
MPRPSANRPPEAGADRLTRSPGLLVAGVTAAMLALAALFGLSSIHAITGIDQYGISEELIRAGAALEIAAAQAAEPLDADAVRRLGARFDFRNAHLGTAADVATGQVSVAMPGPPEALGPPLRFIWSPVRLGTEIFAGTALFRYCIAAVVFLLVGFIFYRFDRLARELDRERQAARRLAGEDSLTGLANRLQFEPRLTAALAEFARTRRPLALFYLDLNHFKQVNDTLGHAAGDAVLRAVAGRLRQVSTPDDTVARLGGDEFAIIHPYGGNLAELAEFATGLHAVLSLPYDIDGQGRGIGASIGIATAPEHGISADALLRHADAALYRAKAQTDAAFVFADTAEPPMSRVA